MVMRDRETDSLWSCYNGVALEGELEGAAFDRVPSYLCQLHEWLEEHPDTEVLTFAGRDRHADPRHGHGSWFYFGCRGPHPHAMDTMLGDGFDDRLPESELVLGVIHGERTVAFPLSAVHSAGCVVHTELDGDSIVVWARSHASPWMAAFFREVDGETLEFDKDGTGFVDRQTGSRWTVEGRAVSGSHAGRSLDPVDFVSVKWSAWAGFQPGTEVFDGTGDGTDGTGVPDDGLGDLRGRVEGAGHRLEVESQILGGTLPPAAEEGWVVWIDGDRFSVYRFSDAERAADYAASGPLLPRDRFLSFFPGEEPSDLPRHAVVSGAFVVESDPERPYADRESLERLPEAEIDWSRLLSNDAFLAALDAGEGKVASDGPFGRLFGTLREAGFRVDRVKPMLRQWLRPAAVDGYSAEVDGDRFLVYEFDTPEAARRYQAERHHTVAAGPFVLRSDPPGQYHVATEGTIDRPVDQVPWSDLLEDDRFIGALGAVS